MNRREKAAFDRTGREREKKKKKKQAKENEVKRDTATRIHGGYRRAEESFASHSLRMRQTIPLS